MASMGPLLIKPAVEAVRGDILEMTRGLELVARSLVAAAEHCAAMEARLDERQRLLDQRWQHIEEQAHAMEASLVERWCNEGDGNASPQVRLTALEQSVARTLESVFPRVEELLVHMNIRPTPSPRHTNVQTKLPCTSNLSPSTSKCNSVPHASSSLISPTPTPHASPSTPNSKTSTSTLSSSGTALRNAANFGKHEELKSLLQQGVDVNFANKNGRTALHCAAFRGDQKCISTLLQHGASVNCADKDKMTPLHCAAINGHENAARTLLHTGADPFAKDISGNTPFDVATAEPVRELLQAASERTRRNASASSQVTADSPGSSRDKLLRSFSNSGCAGEVLALLQEGADPNSCNINGRTALHLAALNGHAETVKYLLQYSANTEALDCENCTPLFYAQRNRHMEVSEILQHARIFGYRGESSDDYDDSDYS